MQHLSLDLTNCSESLDEELLELVKMCEQLVRLGIWAFLEIRTVGRLLNIRLNHRSSLNKIKVRSNGHLNLHTQQRYTCIHEHALGLLVSQVGIYTMNEDTREQEEELEEVMLSYLHLPPELDFTAKFYHFE